MFTGFGYEKKGRGCKIKLNNGAVIWLDEYAVGPVTTYGMLLDPPQSDK
jgi:hypothetical protein